MNVALTALSLVIEQNDGTQERTWITGIYICNKLIIIISFFLLRCKNK